MCVKKVLYTIIIFCICGGMAIGQDVYYYIPLKELNITSGKFPESTQSEDVSAFRDGRSWGARQLIMPYAVSDSCEEIYVVFVGAQQRSDRWHYTQNMSTRLANTYIAVRAQNTQKVQGSLFIPADDCSEVSIQEFTLSDAPADQEKCRLDFLRAKKRYYQRLLDMNIPGAAWFRHQVRLAESELAESEDDDEDEVRRRQRRRDSDLRRMYSLFSGSTALSENLQLGRELTLSDEGEQTIPVDLIEGITVTEIDWTEHIKDKDPKTDYLASYIPADQHAVFFRTFAEMTKFTDQTKAQLPAVIAMLRPTSERSYTNQRYEEQMCVTMDKMSRFLGKGFIASVAFTGSDLDIQAGSDVAVLFEARSNIGVKSDIEDNQKKALSKFEDAQKVSGQIKSVKYKGVVTPDRRICSYLAEIKNAVIATNSLAQLEKIIDSAEGKKQAMSELDEYIYFRNRYELSNKDETALVVITDAAIRRWCGPKWRIGGARRIRAAAILAQLQAEYMPKFAEAADTGSYKKFIIDKKINALGELSMTESGIRSSIWGSLNYLTPINELNIEKVTETEKQAYERFRDNYQRSWSQFFDPVAISLSIEDERLSSDITIRPLIVESEYREFMEIAGTNNISADTGEPHAEAILQFVMSLDTESEPVKELGNFLLQFNQQASPNMLNWLGDWLTVYVDEDVLWDELQQARQKPDFNNEKYIEENLYRLPVALCVDVKDPIKLAAFMVALRAFVNQTVPGLTAWQSLTYNDKDYVKVTVPTTDPDSLPNNIGKAAVYYAAATDKLIVTLNEEVLKRSLDRISAKQNTENIEPWLGQSMCLQVEEQAFSVLDSMFNENLVYVLERQSWSNIPILNEWARVLSRKDAVDFHHRFQHRHLLCPGGGRYVWNEKYKTIESTTFGFAGLPKQSKDPISPLEEIKGLNIGVTFEGDGLRARVDIQRAKKE